MPNWQEQAELVVGSLVFQDWESVYVQHRWQQAWPVFKFTSTEGDLPFDYRKLQFKPGDPCEILLGGQLAVTGIITNRQVSYTATEHGIQLSGGDGLLRQCHNLAHGCAPGLAYHGRFFSHANIRCIHSGQLQINAHWERNQLNPDQCGSG